MLPTWACPDLPSLLLRHQHQGLAVIALLPPPVMPRCVAPDRLGRDVEQLAGLLVGQPPLGHPRRPLPFQRLVRTPARARTRTLPVRAESDVPLPARAPTWAPA